MATLAPARPGGPVASVDTPTRKGRRRRGRIVLGLAIVIVVGMAVVTSGTSTAVRRQLLLSFTRQPDNFAELYFPSPGTLPTSFVPGQPFSIAFALTNDSDVTRSYAYVVTARSATGRVTVRRASSLHVRANHTVLTPLRISLPSGTTSLSISLPGQPVIIRVLLQQGAAHGG